MKKIVITSKIMLSDLLHEVNIYEYRCDIFR